MNKLLIYPLMIMLVLTVFNQFYVYSQASISSTNSQLVNPVTGNLSQNSENNQISTSGTTVDFSLNMTTGFIAFIIGISALGGVLGITVLGSGISERAQKIIFTSILYFGLWGIFSVLTYTMYSLIPIFGILGWLGFTMIYCFGFFKELNTHTGN